MGETDILSPDRQYRWDGQAWQPVAPCAPPPTPVADSVNLVPSATPKPSLVRGRNLVVWGSAAGVIVLAFIGWLAFGQALSGGSAATAKTHVMTGVLTINDPENVTCNNEYGSATDKMQNLTDFIGGKVFPCDDGPGGGYSDIADGTSVSVFDASGTLIATGNLEGGTASSAGIQFSFTVEDVPTERLYQVEVANRGKVPYSQPMLESNQWAISLKLG